MSAAHMSEIPNREDLEPVIQAARSALDLETARAERFDTKARGQMTLAGSWFAVVQAVAAVVLGAGITTGWVGAIVVTAALAAAALVEAMRQSAKVWKLRPQPAITQETLEDMAHAAQSSPPTFSTQLVQQYRHLLGHAQAANEDRAEALDCATKWWWVALAAAFGELAVALLSRVFSG